MLAYQSVLEQVGCHDAGQVLVCLNVLEQEEEGYYGEEPEQEEGCHGEEPEQEEDCRDEGQELEEGYHDAELEQEEGCHGEGQSRVTYDNMEPEQWNY